MSANSPFALLSNVGEDDAGAAQFTRPDRINEATQHGELVSVDEEYIADRLRILRGDRSAWDDAKSPGQFNLAGAQSKFALHRDHNGNWAIPTGRRVSTHIFKPPLAHLAHQEVNEHLCLKAAPALGMPAARSEAMRFGEEDAIVLERYDRLRQPDGSVVRVHQEDICQALGVQPSRKYQRGDGGPGPSAIVDLFRQYQPTDAANQATERFCRALAYNSAIYGPDGHAKNYSLLLSGNQVRLAPLYDVSSVAAYPEAYDLRHMTMAMSVDGKYENNLVTGLDWRALATRLGVDPDEMTEWVYDVASNVSDAISDAIAGEERWVRDLAMTSQLVDGVAESVKVRLRYLDQPRRFDYPPLDVSGVSISKSRKPYVSSYVRADGTPVRGYRNPNA